MTMERYWLSHRESFLDRAEQAEDNQALLTQYHMLMEQMKMEALAQFPHDDVLRQQTALLFYEAMQGAEMLLARSEPMIVRGNGGNAGKKRSFFQQRLLRILMRRETSYVILGAGLLVCLLGSKELWRAAVFFVAALGVQVARERCAPAAETDTSRAVSKLRLEYLDAFILRQAKLLDQHMKELQTLFQDAIAPLTEETPDEAALLLCQYAWAAAKNDYPAESVLYAAEKLVHQTGLVWTEYSPQTRSAFDVLPSQQSARMIYPALRKNSDGTLVSKGQYIEPKATKERKA